MERIKKIFTRVHIVLWILFSLLLALQLSQDSPHGIRLTVAVLLTCLYVFYSHFYLLTQYSDKKKKGDYYLKLAGIVLTGPIMYVLLHYKKLDTLDLFSEYYFVSLFSIILPFTFLSWLARITENLVLNTIRKEQLEKQAVEAELTYLKSQINPHFLFNTLNNIHTLVYKQTSAAPEAIMRLSSLMRYMIYESNAYTVPLSLEINYLKDYIGLQQLRYKTLSIVDFQVEGDTDTCHIAPLLFIHLLENAYKHTPARLESGSIKVRLKVKENKLTFSLENPVGSRRENLMEEQGGIGLPNVKKRLQLIYPDHHSLHINKTDEVFTVRLEITNFHTIPTERKDHVLHN